MSSSLRNDVALAYYKTTAARGHQSSREYYEQAARGLRRRLRPWLPTDRAAVCLDLACGCGEMIYLLEREGFTDTTGVDLCPEELHKAQPFLKGALVQADALEYLRQCRSASVDFLTALNFLEHLPKDILLAVLTEIRRVLRPEGVFVAMVPNAISPFGSLTRHWDITHEWAFTPNNFRQLAALTGFDAEVAFRECGPVAHGFTSAVRYLLWQAIRAGIAVWFLIELGNAKGRIYTMDMLVRLRVPERPVRD